MEAAKKIRSIFNHSSSNNISIYNELLTIKDEMDIIKEFALKKKKLFASNVGLDFVHLVLVKFSEINFKSISNNKNYLKDFISCLISQSHPLVSPKSNSADLISSSSSSAVSSLSTSSTPSMSNKSIKISQSLSKDASLSRNGLKMVAQNLSNAQKEKIQEEFYKIIKSIISACISSIYECSEMLPREGFGKYLYLEELAFLKNGIMASNSQIRPVDSKYFLGTTILFYLENFRSNNVISFRSCKIIWMISVVKEDIRLKLLNEKAHILLLSTINTHNSDSAVGSNAFAALSSLLKVQNSEKFASDILQQNGREIILKAIKSQKKSRGTQINALEVVESLIKHSKIAKSFNKTPDSYVEVIKTIETYSDHKQLTNQCERVLKKLFELIDDDILKIVAIRVRNSSNKFLNSMKIISDILTKSSAHPLPSTSETNTKKNSFVDPLKKFDALFHDDDSESHANEEISSIISQKSTPINLSAPQESSSPILPKPIEKFSPEQSQNSDMFKLLENSFSYFEYFSLQKEINRQVYNLKINLMKYKNHPCNPENVKMDKECSKLISNYSEKMRNILQNINDLENKLGFNLLNPLADKNSINLINERNAQRNELVSLSKEYYQIKNTIKSSATGTNEEQNEFENIKENLKNISACLQKNIIQINFFQFTRFSPDIPIYQFPVAQNIQASNLDISIVGNGSEWLKEAQLHIGESKLEKELYDNFKLIYEHILKAMDIAKMCKEESKASYRKLFEPISNELLNEVDQILNQNSSSEIIQDQAIDDDFIVDDFVVDENKIKREWELYYRYQNIEILYKLIKESTIKIFKMKKEISEIEFELFCANESKVSLENKMNLLLQNIEETKYNRFLYLEEVMHLSQNMNTDEDNSDIQIIVIKYDFPESPLTALSCANQIKSDTPQDITELLYNSGFFCKHSINDDYEFKNLPGDIQEIANSDEIKNSSVRICKLKFCNDLKLIQSIDMNDFKSIRDAIVLAYRAHYLSILPIEAVFADEEGGKSKVFIQTPYKQGGSMKSWLSKSKRSIGHKLDALSKVADGLDTIHNHGIVHRDIKLENIVMETNNDDSNAFICNFGFYDKFDVTDSKGLNLSISLHLLERGIGTIRYMAPEIFYKNEKSINQSDVWSFVMLMMITLAFDGDYNKIPMIKTNKGIDRVDINKSINIAVNVLGNKYQKLINLFRQVLPSNEEKMQNGSFLTQRPKMNEIRDILINLSSNRNTIPLEITKHELLAKKINNDYQNDNDIKNMLQIINKKDETTRFDLFAYWNESVSNEKKEILKKNSSLKELLRYYQISNI